jgi:hypothetical protein
MMRDLLFLSSKSPVISVVEHDDKATGATYQQTRERQASSEPFPSNLDCIPEKIKSPAILKKNCQRFQGEIINSRLITKSGFLCLGGGQIASELPLAFKN